MLGLRSSWLQWSRAIIIHVPSIACGVSPRSIHLSPSWPFPTMNWTGGGLSRSRNHAGSIRDVQRQHFARARTKLQSGDTRPSRPELSLSFSQGHSRRMSPVPPSGHDQSQPLGASFSSSQYGRQNNTNVAASSPHREPLDRLDHSTRQQMNARYGGFSHGSPQTEWQHPRAIQPPRTVEPAKFDVERRRLLDNEDWVGITFTRPLKIKYRAGDLRDIGKRRKLNPKDHHLEDLPRHTLVEQSPEIMSGQHKRHPFGERANGQDFNIKIGRRTSTQNPHHSARSIKSVQARGDLRACRWPLSSLSTNRFAEAKFCRQYHRATNMKEGACHQSIKSPRTADPDRYVESDGWGSLCQDREDEECGSVSSSRSQKTSMLDTGLGSEGKDRRNVTDRYYSDVDRELGTLQHDSGPTHSGDSHGPDGTMAPDPIFFAENVNSSSLAAFGEPEIQPDTSLGDDERGEADLTGFDQDSSFRSLSMPTCPRLRTPTVQNGESTELPDACLKASGHSEHIIRKPRAGAAKSLAYSTSAARMSSTESIILSRFFPCPSANPDQKLKGRSRPRVDTRRGDQPGIGERFEAEAGTEEAWTRFVFQDGMDDWMAEDTFGLEQRHAESSMNGEKRQSSLVAAQGSNISLAPQSSSPRRPAFVSTEGLGRVEHTEAAPEHGSNGSLMAPLPCHNDVSSTRAKDDSSPVMAHTVLDEYDRQQQQSVGRVVLGRPTFHRPEPFAGANSGHGQGT